MIVFVADCIERFRFYSRMFKSLSVEFNIVVVTHDPLVLILSKFYSCKCILIKKNLSSTYKVDDEVSVRTSIEVLNEEYLINDAMNNYISVVNSLDYFFSKSKIMKCVIWNGESLIGRAITSLCKKYYIDITYLEISNLPNKMFVDSMGVNAKSSIYFHPEIIDKLPSVSDEKHNEWLLRYEKGKAGILPQAQSKFFRRFITAINYVLKFTYSSSFRKDIDKVKLKNKPRVNQIKLDCLFDIKNEQYIFLPLQVSTDTQIKLNSDCNNVNAIDIAVKKAKNKKLKLVVKIHPAESRQDSIDEIIRKQEQESFILVNLNTIDLIKHATEIIVINSTVGLESLIYDKKITVLGRALYADFDRDKLKKYIHHYLIDGVEYFSNELIPLPICKKLLLIK